MIEIEVNGQNRRLDVDDDTPLLWAVREELGLTGSKFGCGIGQCGACTMHLDGVAVRSCLVPAGAAQGRKVTTIEAVAADGHPLVQAWVAEGVPQCGYCQSGQIMSATALLARDPAPSEQSIRQAMSGNLCRCGSYPRILRAIRRVARGEDS